MSQNLDFGRRISIDDANKILTHHIFLDSYVERRVKGNPSDELREQINKFVDRDFNAFVFDLDLIQNFINEGKLQEAKYLTVLLGAHPEGLTEEVQMTKQQRQAFEEGSFTVVLTLCNKIDEGSAFVSTVNIKDPALEYPPKKVAVQLIKDPTPQANIDEGFLKLNFIP